LAGTRVFAVEDEVLILMTLEDMLVDLECEVAGSAGTLDDAMRKAAELDFAVAILDVNVAGKPIDPVANLVRRRGIPVVVATGYQRAPAFPEIDDEDGVPVLLPKPYTREQLREALAAALRLGRERSRAP
jgi:DNA-binding NarL/FixJ family response regulator